MRIRPATCGNQGEGAAVRCAITLLECKLLHREGTAALLRLNGFVPPC